MHWLARQADGLRRAFIKRFDPRFWALNFPRPMMGAVTTQASDGLKIDLVFYQKEDLAGLIWDSEDLHDHPLLAYETNRDYSGVSLSFRWQSTGIRSLPSLHGPTLTIEGRDAAGNPKSWFVRLWNYAAGSDEDAVITLDFDSLDGGFLLPSEADPVYPKDIDRMFISMVPPDYDGVSTGPIESSPGVFAAASASVTISAIKAEGGGSSIAINDAYLPPHRLRLANGYDDSFNVTPERLLRNMRQLGYRNWLDHYIGMSHYFRLAWDAGEARFVAARDVGGAVLNAPAAAWHADFFARAQAMGVQVIMSLSFEMFDEWTPNDWKQRTHDNSPALTGWSPPSTLLTPTHTGAMDYLRDALLEAAALANVSGMAVHAQIGEPWWWFQLTGGNEPCFYDATTTALYVSETSQPVPAKHLSIFETPNAAQQAYLDWLGDKLGAATLTLRDAVKTAHPAALVSLLFFTPQVLIPNAQMLASVNLPTAWAFPAFDVFQVEDYEHVINGEWAAHAQALAVIESSLGYGPADSHYFAGFILGPNDAPLWRNIARAIDDGFARNFAEVFVWAYPQILRDGFTYFEQEDEPVAGFHDVRFPSDISFGSSGGPSFSTSVVEMASGAEQRNSNWAQARARYDIGGGIRAEDDLATVVAFFRARAGRAHGFRFKDWADYKSCAPSQAVTPLDQQLGTGDGVQANFQLIKFYTDSAATHSREIKKPVAGTVRVALDSAEQAGGWSVDITTGVVTFTQPPAMGVVITAGFEFDVPVRFADDALAVTLDTFRAGEVPRIALVEIRG